MLLISSILSLQMHNCSFFSMILHHNLTLQHKKEIIQHFVIKCAKPIPKQALEVWATNKVRFLIGEVVTYILLKKKEDFIIVKKYFFNSMRKKSYLCLKIKQANQAKYKSFLTMDNCKKHLMFLCWTMVFWSIARTTKSTR